MARASTSRGEGWTFSYKGKKSTLELRLKVVTNETLWAVGKVWDKVIPNKIIPAMKAKIPDSLLLDALLKTGHTITYRPWKDFMPKWRSAAGGHIIGHSPIGYHEIGTVKTRAHRDMAKVLKKMKGTLLAPLEGILK